MLPVLLGTLLAASCPASPVDHPGSPVIGPSRGQPPAWVVDGSNGRWSGAEERIKTLWVLSTKARGALRITGRRLDGHGDVRFQKGTDAAPQPTFEIADPWRGVTPGGATPEIMANYAFLSSYVIYPSRGCWQFTVRLGADETRITIEIR